MKNGFIYLINNKLSEQSGLKIIIESINLPINTCLINYQLVHIK